MSMELLRLGLQFFAEETKEEEEEVIIPGEEGVTDASSVTGNTSPAYTMPQNTVDAPVAQDFDTWYKANGGMDETGYYAKYDLDPERDYQNTVNTLNYEYQTSMANYGENAEKMYQMGLQNSGVSDIFQANAFSAYLGNMNQAAADRITARKRNKAAFEDYVAGKKTEYGQYESGIKSEYDTKLNSALTYALSKYNGYNLNQILSELGVSGYYTEIVQDVANRLSGMDSTTLKAETESALAQNIINSISGFTGSDADLEAAKSMFGGMFPDDVIAAAFGRAQAIYQNSAAGQDQMVNDLVTSGQESFDPNYSYIPTDENGEQILDDNGNATEIGGDGGEGSMNAFIKNVWGIETDPNAEGFDQSAYNRAVKAWEQMKNEYDGKIWSAYEFIVNNIESMGEQNVKDYLKAQGLSDAMVAAAFSKYGTSAPGQAYEDEQTQASVDKFVNTWTASFDPNMSKEEFVTKMITGEDGKPNEDLRANAEEAWEQMNSAYESNYQKAYSALLSAGLNSNSTNEAIQTILNNAGINFDDKMIERLRSSLADTEETVKKEEEVQNNEASIAEMDKIDKGLNTTQTTQGYLTTYDYMNAYKEVEAYEAENGETEATKAKKAEYREKILAEANGYLSGDDGYNLKEAGDMLTGFLSQSDVDNWDTMSNDARRRAIISAAKGEVSKKSGLVTVSELGAMVSTYVTERVQKIVDTDNSNAKASGLADAGELVNYINSLGLTKQDRTKAMESIRRGMSFRIEGDQINWYGSVKGAEATIQATGKRVTDEKILSELGDTAATGTIKMVDGKLYIRQTNRSGNTLQWTAFTADSMQIVGDGHTNTAEQRQGIYDLLVYMLELKNKLATDAGYIEGELPTSTTVTVSGTSPKTGSGPSGGGHTKDFATQNK